MPLLGKVFRSVLLLKASVIDQFHCLDSLPEIVTQQVPRTHSESSKNKFVDGPQNSKNSTPEELRNPEGFFGYDHCHLFLYC